MTIKKDYGNSCLNHCVLRLHSNKIIQFQSSMLKVLLFSARFSLIMVTFVLSELPQNRTMNKRGTRRYTQGLNINDLNFPKLFGQMTKIHSYRLKCNALDCQECEHSASESDCHASSQDYKSVQDTDYRPALGLLLKAGR